jgi:TetR/AcrR family transcriptional repressor of nem operon
VTALGNLNSREAILNAAKEAVQAHGYNGLNLRDLAQDVGIKAASIYHHFPSKAELAAAVARRYWEDSSAYLERLLAETADPVECLRRYPETFRWALENGNRMCLSSFMATESDDLPEQAKQEVRNFADVNVAWLSKLLSMAGSIPPAECEPRARAIYSAIAGAQLIARSRSDIALYDELVESYRAAGLLRL